MFSIVEKSEMSTFPATMQEEFVSIKLFKEPCSPDMVVEEIASIKGPVDVYCWYEGVSGLPIAGAKFMKQNILEPLAKQKVDVKLCLYSLRGWDFKEGISNMPVLTTLGEAINRINTKVIECFYSSSFFRYCADVSDKVALYEYLNKELPKKVRLIKHSEGREPCGISIGKFFEERVSLFDCINEMDVCKSYSLMQYIEGYYLIQESIKRGLEQGRRQIEIAFVLPNDEGEYYLELPDEIERMLKLDFGAKLTNIKVNITFRFFKYKNSLKARPYNDQWGQKVEAEEIGALSTKMPSKINLKGEFKDECFNFCFYAVYLAVYLLGCGKTVFKKFEWQG